MSVSQASAMAAAVFLGGPLGPWLPGPVWLWLKTALVMALTVFRQLKAENADLKRDLIFAAVADEEAGCENGSAWLVEEHPEVVERLKAAGDPARCLTRLLLGRGGPRDLAQLARALKEGERLIVEVTAPDYDAFLYVELFDNQGNVIHMLPSPSHPDNEIPAGETVTLGEEPGRVYPMRGEVGTYMILAAAAPSRLFPLDRGEVEDARGYLSDLQSSLRRVDDQPGPDAAVEVFILTLVPGS